MSYSAYLPHINVTEGKTRVMGNVAIYAKLLTKFNGRQMVNNLLESILEGDNKKIIEHSHALRGVASNLSFPTLHEVVDEIESLAKRDMDSTHLITRLGKAIDALEKVIEAFLAESGTK